MQRVLFGILGAASLLAMIFIASCGGKSLLGVSAPSSDWAGKNVILITFDTTRADVLPMYGGDVETPALSLLAQDGIVVDGMRCITPLTLPSHTTILTGLHSIQHGVRDNFNGVLSDAATTMPELFHESGYETAGVVGAILLSRRTGISQGFDYFNDEFMAADFEAVQPMIERKGDLVADLSLKWLDKKQQRSPDAPFFLFAHFYDPHLFYHPPALFNETYKDNLYKGEIAYSDHCVGRIIDYLKEKGLYDDSVIVVVGDHGEGLGQHKEKTHGLFLYDSTVHVPCIIKPPKQSGLHGRCAWNGSLEDIAPTLIDFCQLGRTKTSGVSMKNNFLGQKPAYRVGRKVVIETQYPYTFHWGPIYAMVEDGWKYIHAPKPELYDLKSDPNETKNLFVEQKAKAAFFDQILQMELVQLSKGAGFTPESNLSVSRSEALASLGYVGGGAVAGATDALTLADPKDRIELYEKLDAALAALAQSKVDQAQTQLLEILKQDPDNPSLHLNLSIIYAKKQKWAAAIESMKKAINLAPENHIIKLNLAKTYMSAGQLDEARTILKAFVRQFPKQADGYFQLGRIAYRQNQPQDALDYFHEAERWMPDIPGLAEMLQKTQEKLN